MSLVERLGNPILVMVILLSGFGTQLTVVATLTSIGKQVENKLVVGRFLELELCRHGEHLQGLVKTHPWVVTSGQTPRQGY